MPDISHAELHTERHVRELLFKPDRPRPIDRFIDFFGDTGAPRGQEPDPGPDADDPDR